MHANKLSFYHAVILYYSHVNVQICVRRPHSLFQVFLFSVDPDGSKLHIEIDDKSTTDGLRRVTVNSLYDVDLIVSKETSHIVTMNCTTSTDNLAQKVRLIIRL